MSQKQFHPGQVLASLLQSRSALLLRCLVALLAVSLNIHSGIAFAKDAPSSSLTATQKLQASFDALAKKEAPVYEAGYNNSKNDWYGLYRACSDLFEVRDFSRIFSCVGVAEKWQAKVGDEPTATRFGSKIPPHSGYPTHASVMLIEARAQLETGHTSKAIELTKRSLAENERVRNSKVAQLVSQYYSDLAKGKGGFIRISKTCGFDDTEPCALLYGEYENFIIESNLLLVTALLIEGRRDESAQFYKMAEEITNPRMFMRKVDRKEKAEILAFRVRLFLATEQYEDAIKLIEQDTQDAYLAGDVKKRQVVLYLVSSELLSTPGGL